MELKNKVALVTGASKGIGRAVSLALAGKGANLAIAARDDRQLQETARLVRGANAKVFTFAADLSLEKEMRAFVRGSAEYYGGIDILINNAGFGFFSPVHEFPVEQWDKMFSINMRAVFIGTQEALPFLRKSGDGFIINIASLAGKNAFEGGAGYAATKHALLGFSRCLMLEERKNNVRVLTICPGSVDTPFFDGHENESSIREKRLLQPDDIAASLLHALQLPRHALVSELDIRPANP